jgi:tyrosinase
VNVNIQFPAYDALNRAYVTWRPVQVAMRLQQPPAGVASVPVTVSAKTVAGGGRLALANSLTHQGTNTLDITLPASGAPVNIWVGGAFGSPSARFGDVTLEVRAQAGGPVLGSHATMVRVRKDANALSTPERNRFLAALATLNGQGAGPFANFRDMHVAGPPDDEAHGGPGFLPWHRAYLMDFERELQKINAEVTLPYWRFDQPAPKVFTRAFMGVVVGGQAQFSAANPLKSWAPVAGPVGVLRGPGVGPQTIPPTVATEPQTLGLGGPAATATYAFFRRMQTNPHNRAHMSHLFGLITDPGTAPGDPLFFLLHCNVDRLWAKWQWAVGLHDPASPRSFTPNAGANPGHRLDDPLWPWCGPLPAPRPTTAPGGGLAPSPMTGAPGVSPRPRDLIDYLGTIGPAHLAFAYDDVPFQV